MKIAHNVVIYGGFEIRDLWNIAIGKGTIIGDESKLDGCNGITIGTNVNFSTGVWVWTSEHDLNDPLFSTNEKGGRVIIRDRAWVSTRTIILPKVIIDEGAVVAAGAVVTNDCQTFTVYGGVPARKIGERNRNLVYEFNGTHVPFFEHQLFAGMAQVSCREIRKTANKPLLKRRRITTGKWKL